MFNIEKLVIVERILVNARNVDFFIFISFVAAGILVIDDTCGLLCNDGCDAR